MDNVSRYESLSWVWVNMDTRTKIGCELGAFFPELATSGRCDVAILSADEGCASLHASRNFLEADLGISYENEIRPIIRQFKNKNGLISLVAFKSRNPVGILRGAIFVPGLHKNGVGSLNSLNDLLCEKYYYRSTYAAVEYACTQWRAEKVALSHFCSEGGFDAKIAKSYAYAVANACVEMIVYCPEIFVFCGCCIRRGDLRVIEGYDWWADLPDHVPFNISIENQGEIACIHLDMM